MVGGGLVRFGYCWGVWVGGGGGLGCCGVGTEGLIIFSQTVSFHFMLETFISTFFSFKSFVSLFPYASALLGGSGWSGIVILQSVRGGCGV